MSDSARRARQLETEFLAGVEAKLEHAKGRQLHGSIWQTARHDEEGALRKVMADHRRHDRSLLRELPRNRRFALHGYERRWWFWKRPTGVAIASVLCPLEHLGSGAQGELPPIDVGELLDHVDKLVGDARIPHVVGVCSPSGFSEAARKIRLDRPNVTLVLIEPRARGGWQVSGGDEELSEQVTALFDPEDVGHKLERVREEIAARGADLLVGSLDAESMAGRLALPRSVVEQAFEEAAREDPELKLTRQADAVLLYRGAATPKREKASMGVADRIRALFSKEGDEAQKIDVLAERRAALAQRRDRIYEDIGQLEGRETQLLEQGRQTTSAVAKRRLASQLAQLRKDIARQNTTANMLNSQINIISTDIHNLTLIQQGQVARLPDTEELTQNAVQAEEMLETLKADADLVANLETGVGEVLTSDEELAILQEFEQSPPAAEPAEQTGPAAAPPERTAAPEPPAPPEQTRRQAADPEI